MFGWIQREFIVRRVERLARKGKLDEALTEIENALARRPDDVQLSVQKAWLLSDLHRNDDALLELARGLDLSPHNGVLHMLQGEVLYRKGEYEAAKSSLTKALEYSGENIRVEYLLGLAHIALNDLEKASHYFESSVRYDKLLVRSRLLAMAEHYLFRQQMKGSSLPD
jgi:tetratricopeptide (TPR) repeat protein